MSDTAQKMTEECLTAKAKEAVAKQAKTPETDETEENLWNRSLKFFEAMNDSSQHAKI